MKPKKPYKNRDQLPAGLPTLHALLAPALAHAFDILQVGATIFGEGEYYAIHVPSHVPQFELANGKEREREAYNTRCLTRARETGRAVLGEHAGFSDFFVPIGSENRTRAVLVTGPFQTRRPTSADLLERWHWLTGHQGHPSDRRFAAYVSMTLQTLLLEGDQVRRYQRMLECFATLAAGEGDAKAVAAEGAVLREKLQLARFAERNWEAASEMVDERTTTIWLTTHRGNDMLELGMTEFPEHVLVGLILRPNSDDPLGDILARNAFQRACIDLAHAEKNVLCGRVGDHGVTFLVAGAGSGLRAQRALEHLGTRAQELARRRFGLTLHFGMSSLGNSSPLSALYEQALAAAERALSLGQAFVTADPSIRPGAPPLRELREALAALPENQPKALVAHFERYIQAVTLHCGYRLELVQAHLESGFERAIQGFRDHGAIDEQSCLELFEDLERAGREASTVNDLCAAYRSAIADVAAAAEKPVAAAQDRNLKRAIEYIRQHYAEPLGLQRVARVGGFAPRYFSQLFKRRERMTFEHYVRQLRIERAKQLLSGTDLSVERVAQLCGFTLRPYFHRVFREIVGKTPVEFRQGGG